MKTNRIFQRSNMINHLQNILLSITYQVLVLHITDNFLLWGPKNYDIQ